MALRALGRLQLAAGTPAEAMATLQEAVATFEAIRARYDTARVWLDLGAGGSAAGDRRGGRQPLGAARAGAWSSSA